MKILNVLIAGHAQHGKSSLIQAISGKFPDNLDFELNHGTTVSLKVIQFSIPSKKILINFLDSPGHADFKGGIALGLDFADILVIVVSGSDGLQARTYWLIEKAIEKNLTVILAITKMDLHNVNPKKIEEEINQYEKLRLVSIVKTSSKKLMGIEDLIENLAIQIIKRKKIQNDLSFFILGFHKKKGIGELINIGILSGQIHNNTWINEKIKVKNIFSLKGEPLKSAQEGEIVKIQLNIMSSLDLGSKYHKGKFISPKLVGTLSEIVPRKEFYISILEPLKFKVAIDVLESIKKVIPNLDYYHKKNEITILATGDLQFGLFKERLEDLIEFEIIGSKVKGIITINKAAKATYNSSKVRIVPRIKNKLTVNRDGLQAAKLYDVLGASVAYDAFHLDGLHVDIYSGKNEADIAQAITRAIEKVKIIKIVPYQDVIVKVSNHNALFGLIEKYNIDILYQSKSNSFFLQVKNSAFESFFNSLMKLSNGQADFSLIKFDFEEKILSIDPGMRHFGFCLIEQGALPSLWYVNLKKTIEDKRSHSVSKQQLTYELDVFLGTDRDLITKIFIGNGPGSVFIANFLIDYFNITGNTMNKNEMDRNFNILPAPDIYMVDEFKTTKEALFHLQKGELVNHVKAKGFVDHAIAALLIARRGIKGEILKIKKKPMTNLYDYIYEHYSGTHSFSSIHHVRTLADLKKGMYLRIKDSSKLDSKLNNGDIITFSGFGTNYNSLYATTLTGNNVIVKFQAVSKLQREFFSIFAPVKQR
jgi:small GTP-binding protein